MATPRKVTKAAEALEKHTADMQKVAKEWQAAAGKDKQKLLDKLKKMTSEKRDLESQLQRAIADLDKDTELQIDEMRRLIRNVIREEIKSRKK